MKIVDRNGDDVRLISYLDKLCELKEFCLYKYNDTKGSEKRFWINHYHLLDNHHDKVNEDFRELEELENYE